MSGHDDERPMSDPDAIDDRLRSAMDAFTAPIAGSDDAFERIAARLDDESGAGASRRPGVMHRSYMRPVSIAAAVLVALLIGASAVALVSGDRGVDVVTQPAGLPPGAAPMAIVAATADGRIVELDLDGHERRTIASSLRPSTGRLYPPAFVNPEIRLGPDGTVYFTRLAGPDQSGCFEAEGQIWIASEIVAVPFAGGEPRVVVPVGASFDISPDGRYLAYAGPDDAQRCLDVGSSSLLSVLDLKTGQRTQLANGATIQTGPSHRVRWSADGTEILGTRPPAAAGYPGAVGVTFAGGIPHAARPPQQLMLLPQSPDLLAENERTDPNGTFINSLGVPEAVGPHSFATTVDLVSTTSSGGAQDLVTVEKVKDGPLLLTRAPFDRSVRGDGSGQVVIPTERIAEVGTAQNAPSEWSLAVDRSGSRILVTANQATGLGIGSEPRATYVVEGGTVRLLATNLVAATWVEGAPALPSTTPWSSPEAPAPTDPGTSSPPIAAGTTRPPVYSPGDISLGLCPKHEVAVGKPFCGVDAVPPFADERGRRPDDAEGIARAYERVFSNDLSALEDGETIAALIAEAQPRALGVTHDLRADVTIRAVRFTADDRAQVRVEFRSANPETSTDEVMTSTGGAVRSGGVWKVSRETVCDLLSRNRLTCPETTGP